MTDVSSPQGDGSSPVLNRRISRRGLLGWGAGFVAASAATGFAGARLTDSGMRPSELSDRMPETPELVRLREIAANPSNERLQLADELVRRLDLRDANDSTTVPPPLLPDAYKARVQTLKDVWSVGNIYGVPTSDAYTTVRRIINARDDRAAFDEMRNFFETENTITVSIAPEYFDGAESPDFGSTKALGEDLAQARRAFNRSPRGEFAGLVIAAELASKPIIGLSRVGAIHLSAGDLGAPAMLSETAVIEGPAGQRVRQITLHGRMSGSSGMVSAREFLAQLSLAVGRDLGAVDRLAQVLPPDARDVSLNYAHKGGYVLGGLDPSVFSADERVDPKNRNADGSVTHYLLDRSDARPLQHMARIAAAYDAVVSALKPDSDYLGFLGATRAGLSRFLQPNLSDLVHEIAGNELVLARGLQLGD